MTPSSPATNTFKKSALSYLKRLQECFSEENLEAIEILASELRQAWIDGRNVYICGNGGSAAMRYISPMIFITEPAHAAGTKIPGLRIEALPANTGVITCLANDTGYENIYAHQLEVKRKTIFLSYFQAAEIHKRD